MNLVTGHDSTVAAWIERTYGDVMVRPGYAWGVVNRDGVLVGAFAVTMEHNRTADLAVYGRMSNATVKAMFRAVFGPLAIYRLQIRTHKKHRVIKKAAVKFGFQFEGTQKHFYGPGIDALVYVMTPPTCRWLPHVKPVQVA